MLKSWEPQFSFVVPLEHRDGSIAIKPTFPTPVGLLASTDTYIDEFSFGNLHSFIIYAFICSFDGCGVCLSSAEGHKQLSVFCFNCRLKQSPHTKG